MSGRYILNGAGEPERCDDLLMWAQWFEHNDTTRILLQTTLPDDVRVSTVFLGLDHSFGHGRPLLFETMVFGGPHDGRQERYATRADAAVGHGQMIEKVLE